MKRQGNASGSDAPSSNFTLHCRRRRLRWQAGPCYCAPVFHRAVGPASSSAALDSSPSARGSFCNELCTSIGRPAKCNSSRRRMGVARIFRCAASAASTQRGRNKHEFRRVHRNTYPSSSREVGVVAECRFSRSIAGAPEGPRPAAIGVCALAVVARARVAVAPRFRWGRSRAAEHQLPLAGSAGRGTGSSRRPGSRLGAGRGTSDRPGRPSRSGGGTTARILVAGAAVSSFAHIRSWSGSSSHCDQAASSGRQASPKRGYRCVPCGGIGPLSSRSCCRAAASNPSLACVGG